MQAVRTTPTTSELITAWETMVAQYVDAVKYHPTTRPAIERVLQYIVKQEAEPPLSIRRGMLLVGNVGGGKTFLMRTALQMVAGRPGHFRFPSAMDYANECYDQVTKGLLYQASRSEPEFGLDDIGREPTGKRFGLDFNPVAELIEVRYEQWLYRKWKTHFTTNLNDDQLAVKYGPRAISRLLQMNQHIPMAHKADSPDLRKVVTVK